MPVTAKNSRLFEAVRLRMMGKTAKQIADELGVSTGHVHKLFIDPRFKAALQEGQDELTASTLAILTAGTRTAAARMLAITQSTNDAIALRACDLVLTHASRLAELLTFGERLENLEQALQSALANNQVPSGPNIRIVDRRELLPDEDGE